MAPHSSTLAWKIPWAEEPGRLQSMGSQRVRHDWQLHFHFSLSCTGEGNGNPLQCSCLENPRDGGTWQAAVYGVAQSRTRLKRLSSSSRRSLGKQRMGGSRGEGHNHEARSKKKFKYVSISLSQYSGTEIENLTIFFFRFYSIISEKD